MKSERILTNNGNILDGPVLLKPNIYNDSRGYFIESWNQEDFNNTINDTQNFVLDTHSLSYFGTLRGLHYQIPPNSQGKLIRCIRGLIFDVIVDIRKNSNTYLEWASLNLSEEKNQQIWVPSGFAHGFLTLSEKSEIIYKNTSLRSIECERTISWEDDQIGIEWPKLNIPYIISEKDKKGRNINKLYESEFF